MVHWVQVPFRVTFHLWNKTDLFIPEMEYYVYKIYYISSSERECECLFCVYC